MAQASSEVAVARSAPRTGLEQTRPGWFNISGRTALLLVLLAILLYLIVPPLYTVVETSFFQIDARGNRGALTLANYATLLQQGHLLESFLNTAAFGLGSTVLALVLGGALAVIVSRTNTPLRGLGHAVAFTSLAVPYVLYTIAWLLILGKRGPVNLALMALFGLSSPPIDAYSLWTMIAIEGFLWSPLSFLMLSTTFRAMDPALEESGMTSGAGVWQTLTRVTLPLAWPAILSTGLLVFIRAFESFEIPALIGMPGRIYVLTTQVYQDTKLTPPDYGGASAYAVVLMAFVLVALHFYGRTTRQATRFATVSGKAYRPRVLDLGPMRYATSALVAYRIGPRSSTRGRYAFPETVANRVA